MGELVNKKHGFPDSALNATGETWQKGRQALQKDGSTKPERACVRCPGLGLDTFWGFPILTHFRKPPIKGNLAWLRVCSYPAHVHRKDMGCPSAGKGPCCKLKSLRGEWFVQHKTAHHPTCQQLGSGLHWPSLHWNSLGDHWEHGTSPQLCGSKGVVTATKQKVPNQGFSVQLSKQTAWGGQLGTAQARALVQHRLKEKRESTASTWLAQDIFSVASATSYCEPVTDAAQQVVDGLKVKLAKDEAGLAKGHRFGKPIHSSIYLAIHPLVKCPPQWAAHRILDLCPGYPCSLFCLGCPLSCWLTLN